LTWNTARVLSSLLGGGALSEGEPHSLLQLENFNFAVSGLKK